MFPSRCDGHCSASLINRCSTTLLSAIEHRLRTLVPQLGTHALYTLSRNWSPPSVIEGDYRKTKRLQLRTPIVRITEINFSRISRTCRNLSARVTRVLRKVARTFLSPPLSFSCATRCCFGRGAEVCWVIRDIGTLYHRASRHSRQEKGARTVAS